MGGRLSNCVYVFLKSHKRMLLGTVNATVIFVPAKLPRFMTPLKGRHSVSPAHGGHSTPLPARDKWNLKGRISVTGWSKHELQVVLTNRKMLSSSNTF